MAYCLCLLEGARLHDVFHVGLLKPFHREPSASTPPLPPNQDGCVVLALARVRRARLHHGVWDILVEWQGLPTDDATWEPRQSFVDRYPDFQLKDGLFAEEGRDVRAQEPAQVQAQAPSPAWITYQRRGRHTSGLEATIFYFLKMF